MPYSDADNYDSDVAMLRELPHPYDHPCTGAVLQLDETEVKVLEGNTGTLSPQEVCLELTNSAGGLDRDILIIINSATNNATSENPCSIQQQLALFEDKNH
jgi:hypothetical protein